MQKKPQTMLCWRLQGSGAKSWEDLKSELKLFTVLTNDNALNTSHALLVYNACCPEWWPVGLSLWAGKKKKKKGKETELLPCMSVPLKNTSWAEEK